MDSGRTENLLQQYIMQIQNLHSELRAGCEQQDQNGTNQHGSRITNNAIAAEISRVAMLLPLFWAERPVVWFTQAVTQFTLAGISSVWTKFCYVILQLDQRYAVEVEVIITSPSEQDPYTTLEAEVAMCLSPSREQRIRQFVTLETGDRKPFQFLRQLGSLFPDDFLRSIWSSCPTLNVRAILAGQPEGGLNAAGHCADCIIEVAPQPALVSVAPLPHSNALQQRIEDLSCQVTALSAELAHLCSSSRKQHSGNRPPS
jgi:hypothetical protein